MPFSTSQSVKTIFEGEHVQVIHQPQNSEWTLLTFDIMHARANGKSAFASTLAKNMGVNFIGVVPKYPCWYPKKEMEEVADIVKASCIGETLAYGASMGAYGALRWGRLFGADSTLACSPQATIEPAVLGERDKRYQSRYVAELHAGMRIEAGHLAKHNFVIADRFFKQDFVQASLLPSLRSLRIVFAPFMFHSTAKCITGSENAAKIFRAALTGDTSTIRSAIRRKRIETAERKINLAKTCNKKGRPQLAVRIMEGMEEFYPTDFAMLTADAQK